MKNVLLFYLFISILDTIPKRISIDVAQINQVNVSEIAKSVIAIPLKTTEFIFHNIDKVFLIKENIFIWEIFQEEGVTYSRALKFDLSGNFKGQIGERDPVSKEFLRIYDMKFDEFYGLIYLVYQDGNRVYDENGNYLNFYKANGRSIGVRAVQEFIFKNQIWGTEYSEKNDIYDHIFIRTDLTGDKKSTLKSFKVKNSTNAFRIASLSVHDKELYFSIGIDNILYKVNQNSLTPIYRVEFTHLPASNLRLHLTQLVVGHYVKNEYLIKGVSYNLVFNTETSKSFNIKYVYKEGILTSGLKDDIYNTGYFDFIPTNQEDYIYFIKNLSELKESKLYDPKLTNTVLFLVKLK